LFASASGLDPHISPDAAFFQVQRIANTRQIDVKRINDLVDSLIELPQYGFLGDKRINVLKLNLALDKLNNQRGTHL
jgi:K+-transporting ATPase ATPase C chain